MQKKFADSFTSSASCRPPAIFEKVPPWILSVKYIRCTAIKKLWYIVQETKSWRVKQIFSRRLGAVNINPENIQILAKTLGALSSHDPETSGFLIPQALPPKILIPNVTKWKIAGGCSYNCVRPNFSFIKTRKKHTHTKIKLIKRNRNHIFEKKHREKLKKKKNSHTNHIFFSIAIQSWKFNYLFNK